MRTATTNVSDAAKDSRLFGVFLATFKLCPTPLESIRGCHEINIRDFVVKFELVQFIVVDKSSTSQAALGKGRLLLPVRQQASSRQRAVRTRKANSTQLEKVNLFGEILV
jgi:hypothetical protein